MTTQNSDIDNSASSNLSIPLDNPELYRTLINNLSEGLIFSQGVDPYSSNLVAIFGSGSESDNRHAIKIWVNNIISKSGINSDEPILILNQLFSERIEEVYGFYS